MMKYIHLIICILLTCSNSQNNQIYEIEFLIFSGTPNPRFTINSLQLEFLNSRIINTYRLKKVTKVMGYTGIYIHSLNRHIRAEPYAELYLLNQFEKDLPEAIHHHIKLRILNEYELGKSEEIIISPEESKDTCDRVIIGPDTVPKFDPKTDNNGCYITNSWENNCYNYGTDVLTNTFAQPCRGTDHKWEDNTSEDVKRAAISDGFEWVGNKYPADGLEKAHYVALLIWPDNNFHWVRLDSNGEWSHKPGGTPVMNHDNDGKLNTDPAKQDFSSWSKFFGYFEVVPILIKIN
jgi:hypothetical protein